MGPIDKAAQFWKRIQAVYLLTSNGYFLTNLERYFGASDTSAGYCLECSYQAGLVRKDQLAREEDLSAEQEAALQVEIQEAARFLKEDGYAPPAPKAETPKHNKFPKGD